MSGGLRRAWFLFLAWACAAGHSLLAAPPPLAVRGSDLVDEAGRVVTLRGCNLGNWFLFEAWMMEASGPGEPRDHAAILRLLERRFGPKRAGELLNLYRENWIGARDFALIRSFGFNVVRLPFHHGLIEDPKRPGRLRRDAFRWLDRVVALAAEAGVYVILDMHGAPGSQSVDHVTGEAGRNEFWLPENRRRGAALWEAIARHYRNDSTVVAYDLLNEPYGRMGGDRDDDALTTAMDELVAAVRRGDSEKLIYCAGALRGIEVFGSPAARGWRHVGFTEPYYPGLYGDETSLSTQALFLNAKVPTRGALLRRWNAPFLVGEFNPVLTNSGGPEMLRRYFDAFASEGWAATMWSYKLVKRAAGAGPEPWYLATNAEPLEIPSLATATDAEIATFFRSLGTMSYALSDAQLDALRREEPPARLALAPAGPMPPVEQATLPESWRLWNVGDAYPRAAAVWSADGSLALWGGGRDIYAGRDEFGFLVRPQAGDFEISVEVSFDGIAHRHAKAGLMLRAGPEENAPLVMAQVFPDGRSVLAVRSVPGGRIAEQSLLINALPVRLTLRRQGARFTAIAEAGAERTERVVTVDGFPDQAWLGPFVLSHDGAVATKAEFRGLSLPGADGASR